MIAIHPQALALEQWRVEELSRGLRLAFKHMGPAAFAAYEAEFAAVSPFWAPPPGFKYRRRHVPAAPTVRVSAPIGGASQR